VAKQHYQSIAENFEDNWFFSQNYTDQMVHFLVKALTIQKDHHFLDLGCGTGHFAKRIIQESSSEPSIVTGVDFSENMIRQFLKHLPKASGIFSALSSCSLKRSRPSC